MRDIWFVLNEKKGDEKKRNGLVWFGLVLFCFVFFEFDCLDLFWLERSEEMY